MIAIITLVLALVYVTLNVILVVLRNYKAHQFFKTKAPKLPVVPNPNIFAGHMFKITFPDKNWKIIEDLHEKYGPTFGYYMCDQPWVSTKDLDLVKLIEIDQGYKHINRTRFGLPFKEFNDSIFQVKDDDWRRARKAIAPALTNHKVRSEEVSEDIEHILKQVQQMLEMKLDESEANAGERSAIIDVHDVFRRYTLGVIFLVLYKRDDVIDFQAEHDDITDQMEVASRSVTNPIVAISVMFPFLRSLCTFLVQFHPVGQMQKRFVDYIIEATDMHRVARSEHQRMQRKLSAATGAKERPFSELKSQKGFKRRLLDTIIDSLMEKKISYDEFVGSVLFFMLAGFETTADTITCLVWHLAQQPEIQNKLRKAIIEKGVDDDYVLWCINETLRWHAAVPLGTGRILAHDVTVNGMFLPKGAFIMPTSHGIQRDNDIWPDADTFKPERWKDSSLFHPAAFLGFGLGPRNCVGGKLALYEIKLAIKLLMTNYRIEKCAETSKEYNFSSPGLVFTLVDQPIKIRLVELNKSNTSCC